MKEYLCQTVDIDDVELVSVIDDLPLWSAPFGLKLLDTIELRKNMNVLDVGCGLGFPLIEIAQRLGDSCKIYGIDPWERALERVRFKTRIYRIRNVNAIRGYAENMPFENDFCDLIVSNNGMNNVNDMHQTIRECWRVCKQSAQMTFTLNLEETMMEFYSVFQETLEENRLYGVVPKMKEHIHSKRRPFEEIGSMLEESGFFIKDILHDSFRLRFVDGTTMFHHSLIRYWFVDGWKSILRHEDLEPIFDQVERKLNELAEKNGEIVLSIPYVTIDCRKK